MTQPVSGDFYYVGYMTPAARERFTRMVKGFNSLSVDAQEALARSGEKFRQGAKEHGELDVKPAKWRREFLNELLDERHYLIFEIMRLEREEQG